MTEQKKPEVGEWWFADDTGVRVYFCGRTAEGVLLYQDDSKQVEQDRVLIWHTWHHEPDCTGWDWEKPDWVTQDRVPARPGIDQRRWVNKKTGEVAMDWCFVAEHSTGKKHGYKAVDGDERLELRCLRKDLPPVQEVWPKYYETTVPGELAFLRRDTATRATYVLTDGKEDGAIVWGCADEWRKELTESEALSRIVKPAEPQPAEDPDEWVIITDMSHVCRSGSDEITACGQNQGWCDGGIWKGKTLAEWKAGRTYPEKFLFRCRRRDLPVKPEPQPAPLRIYMTVDGALYCDTKPRTPLHKQVQFSSCGCFVVEVANGQNHQ